MTITTHKAA